MIRLRFSLATLAAIARDLRRDGLSDGGAWRGVILQVRRYADKLRWARRRQSIALRPAAVVAVLAGVVAPTRATVA